ncbi:hypothetical protein V9T40_014138 [Parthenolecanium corni]|uniref:Diacylglycerol kinase n=1 Tax=Parthenolecanium corni TaxID=536013 RepID=A0AAN9TEL8_9HEMI
MEDWLASLKATSYGQSGSDVQRILSGQHTWHATSHARPTYCNVCREQLSGVTSHGLSCEVCKCKVHKRCVTKTINNCKWTTLASVGKEIIEDRDGNILMPHQWMEGNLPVSAKCTVCEKTCGSVLKMQDWRCLWCRTCVHTACRPKHSTRCPLGPNHVSVVPPTAIHSIGTDDAWEAVRPQGCSPLLVFVNSKSGDNQGVKFLRRFRQILNPAQVFDLISSGPTLGLKLFRHFDPFRVLVCSGDGSVGWVLSEIDRLNMQLQCEVGVLPLGTGNDLARVLGWGASCDDDAHLPQLLERYERASPKILDRWSIMVFERSLNMGDGGKLTLNSGLVEESNLASTFAAYENSVSSQLTNILQSDQHTIVVESIKILCETIKDFITKVSDVGVLRGDKNLNEKCCYLKSKLSHLLDVLKDEQLLFHDPYSLKKDRVLLRANSLKRAVRKVVEHTEKAADDVIITFPSSSSAFTSHFCAMTDIKEQQQQQLSPIGIPNICSISPLPDFRRESSSSTEMNLALPVPQEFADSRHGSFTETFSEDRPNFAFNFSEFDACKGLRSFSFDNNGLKQPIELEAGDSSRRGSSRINECDVDESYVGPAISDYNFGYFEKKKMNQSEEDFERRRKELEDGEQKDVHDDEMAAINSTVEVDIESSMMAATARGIIREPETLVSLSDDLANIGHIDSSETSDDSPEGSTIRKEETEGDIELEKGRKFRGIDRSSFRGSMKESEHSLAISIEGVFHTGSELDMTNLFSTSPEEDEECSEEYKREMGLEFVKRCSIAHFVEGSDIARKSIKCRHRNKSLDDLEKECIAVAPDYFSSSGSDQKSASNNTVLEIPRICVLAEDTSIGVQNSNIHSSSSINVQICGSNGNLNSSFDGLHLSDRELKPDRVSYTLSETDDEEYVKFRRLDRGGGIANSDSTGPTVIVDPPSPPFSPALNVDRKAPNEPIRRFSDTCRRLSAASPLMSLHCSPSPTRRISDISIPPSESTTGNLKESTSGKSVQKTLPIINPLVRLPQWPNITEPGIISKVLLANADALCAAAVPLMDPDDALMEGFFERCIMNNYFGIGIDAKISLDFHHKREEHPEKCRSRTRNYMWYGVLGSKQWYQKSCKNLEQRLQLECDGQRIPLPSLQGIVVLNIPSFMGGINFWGGSKEDDIFLAPSTDDRILEVVAVFGTVQMAASRLINLQHHRIAQCSTVQINILGEDGVPVQVDGEAWIQSPGMIRIIHKNRMKMLCRNKALECSLRAWEEKQRQIRQQHRLQSNAGKLTSLTEEEMSILLSFIEATTTLSKCVKLLIIRHPLIEADLYRLAATVGLNLERVHPSGKLLRGLELRPAVTELVLSAQRLTEETNALLRDKNLQIVADVEKQLHSALLQMEIELKKCTFIGPTPNSLVYFRILSPDELVR